ncbi:MAG: galactokinase [Clostridiales bacterium]|nr:galactokinase [Clostridiales bacterium]
MCSYSAMLAAIRTPEAMERFHALYGRREGELARQLTRYSQLVKVHENLFNAKEKPLYLVSAPGRVEIIGNHTDHNNGRVMAAAVNLDTVAAVTPRDDMTVCIRSEGYAAVTLSLDDLKPRPEEKGTSAALVRGVAWKMREDGYKLGGFDAAVTSTVNGGSGLSSSAAYEVLICAIFDALYNGFTMKPTPRAQIAQYAENVYFGKPCGLMDQMASSTGGLVAIDFKDKPQVQPLSFRFNEAGYDIVVVNTGSSHDDLTDEYASIRQEMQKVARLFGEEALRRVRPEQVVMEMPRVRDNLGDRAALRALHFFQENDRVKKMVHDVKLSDLGAMFDNIIASGESSWMLLQNVYVPGATQPLALALALAAQQLRGKGAWRVHGGGFAGTTLNFVPTAMTGDFVEKMNQVFGDRACYVLDVRPEGAALVLTAQPEENG